MIRPHRDEDYPWIAEAMSRHDGAPHPPDRIRAWDELTARA